MRIKHQTSKSPLVPCEWRQVRSSTPFSVFDLNIAVWLRGWFLRLPIGARYDPSTHLPERGCVRVREIVPRHGPGGIWGGSNAHGA